MVWGSAEELVAEQTRLGVLTPPPWSPGPGPIVAAGCFVAFARGQQGPGRAGDEGWVGVALTEDTCALTSVVVRASAGASYDPGLLAWREGPMLLVAFGRLARRPDVVLVDATGRDHPRRAGLALHLGAALDLPSVGVTQRPLCAHGVEPADVRGSTAPVTIGDDVVGAWVRTRRGARPVVAHAAWRTDAMTAAEVVLGTTGSSSRTPEPLRAARMEARAARALGEGRRRP
jgi:deoxyribonuclease V